MKFGDLSFPIHQPGLVIPQGLLLGLVGFLLHRQVRITRRWNERAKIEGGVVLVLKHASAAHEIAVLGCSMSIQCAAKLIRFLEDDDVGSVDIAIMDQIGGTGQRCYAAPYKIILTHCNLPGYSMTSFVLRVVTFSQSALLAVRRFLAPLPPASSCSDCEAEQNGPRGRRGSGSPGVPKSPQLRVRRGPLHHLD